MNISKAFSLLLAFAARATNAQRDRDIEKSTNMIEWNDAWDDLEGDGGDSSQNIIGGDFIEPGSRPWLVPVAGKYFCGGSLISPSAVMTAAHCVIDPYWGEWHPPAWIDIDRYSFYDNSTVRRLYIEDTSQCDGDVIYHPYFNGTSFEYDVAIVFLPEPVTDTMPVQLNEDANVPKDDAILDVAGWGIYDANYTLSYEGPQSVEIKYVSNEACTRKPHRYPDHWITDDMMCASGKPGEDSCGGDSGGALTLTKPESEGGGVSNVQVGIVSWGIGCGYKAYPGVYTRVSEVADWVKETVCARKGELCKQSKAGKVSKMNKSKYPDTCIPIPTPSPTVTAQPTTEYPTWPPTSTRPPYTPWPTWDYKFTSYPTWMPTTASTKSGKKE
eukprot:scaffold4471_cov68-Cyclotella_meneghiniana.AAC.6